MNNIQLKRELDLIEEERKFLAGNELIMRTNDVLRYYDINCDRPRIVVEHVYNLRLKAIEKLNNIPESSNKL